MPKKTIAALQIGPSPQGKATTLLNILSFESEITAQKIDLIVLPEAILGGYPKGSSFGTYLGFRLSTGRDEFADYYNNAIDVPGPETDELAALSARTGADIVIGVIERAGSTLYCSALFFSAVDGLVAKHRKLMPTGTERLIWGQGDGSTLPVISMSAGKIGSAICWENHMPLLRATMYAKGVEFWCAPTVDEREVWRASMQHIAHEGRCFVISACQVQPSPAELGLHVIGWEDQRPLIKGNSMIIGPLGEILAGPMENSEGLLVAQVNSEDLLKARYDFDVSGHYARPDIFSLSVDERPKHNVNFMR